MVIVFTAEEKKYIDASGDKWEIKKGCPKHLEKALKRKIYTLQNVQKKMAMRR